MLEQGAKFLDRSLACNPSGELNRDLSHQNIALNLRAKGPAAKQDIGQYCYYYLGTLSIA